MAGGPIAWKSKLQTSVATSSVHAEYVALYDATRETVWLRQLLKELGVEQKNPTVIFEDNKGCISLTSNNRTDPRTKHINVKFHYTREQVANNTIRVEYKNTEDMLADPLTKPVPKPKFLSFRKQIGVCRFDDSDVHLGRRVEPKDGISSTPEHLCNLCSSRLSSAGPIRLEPNIAPMTSSLPMLAPNLAPALSASSGA
jgi:hypothetical protein